MIEILGYHFLPANGCLRFPPYTKVEVGQTLTVDGPLELCNRGLHASVKALDALKYAFGPVVCRVRLSGEILEDTDKLCATERTVLAMADATKVLHEFCCYCFDKLADQRGYPRLSHPIVEFSAADFCSLRLFHPQIWNSHNQELEQWINQLLNLESEVAR